jgi:hypothetical protein
MLAHDRTTLILGEPVAIAGPKDRHDGVQEQAKNIDC